MLGRGQIDGTNESREEETDQGSDETEDLAGRPITDRHGRQKDTAIEDDLYEVKDTLDKLTNGVWFEDVSEHELQKEREGIN